MNDEHEFETWTLPALKEYIQRQHDDLRAMLDERYATQTKAVDAAFLAQQTAMSTALTAAERAVQTALLAAEKAVAKAETAAEKRFEAQNEFRAQLSDQAATFLPRAEAETRIAALSEKTDAKFETENLRVTRNENLLSNIQGRMIAYGAVGAAIGSILTAWVSHTFG